MEARSRLLQGGFSCKESLGLGSGGRIASSVLEPKNVQKNRGLLWEFCGCGFKQKISRSYSGQEFWLKLREKIFRGRFKW